MKFLDMLKREDDCISLSRVCALCTWLLWVVATVYLFVTNKAWAGYDTLTIAAFSFLLIQLANKVVECKLFSVKESEKQ